MSERSRTAAAEGGKEQAAGNRKPRVLLGLTGSVASVLAPELIVALSQFAEVRVVSTKNARFFVDRSKEYNSVAFEEYSSILSSVRFFDDITEWQEWSTMGDEVWHIELRRWADVFVIAPLSANTLGKMANGLCDNLLTCVFRAWDFSKPLIVAPAMNHSMLNSPITSEHIEKITKWGVTVLPTERKLLACNEINDGAMASVKAVTLSVKKKLLIE